MWVSITAVILALVIILTAVLLLVFVPRTTSKYPRATFYLNDGRQLTMTIWEDECPIAATNFIFLAKIGFFDGTLIYDVHKDDNYMRFGDRTGYASDQTRYKDEEFIAGIKKSIFNIEVVNNDTYQAKAQSNKFGYKLYADKSSSRSRYNQPYVVSYYRYNTADFLINFASGNSFQNKLPGSSRPDDDLVAFGAFEDPEEQAILDELLKYTPNPNTGITNVTGTKPEIRIEKVKVTNLDNKKWRKFEFVSYMNTAYDGSAA